MPAKPVQKASERYFSRAIGNALRILEIFQQSRRSLTLSEVTQQANLPKSSAFRILRTLEISGYLRRVESDRFALAPSAAGIPNQSTVHVLEAAQAWMRRLSQEFRETISLAFLFENHIEVIAVIDSPHRISMGNMIGGLIPPHASSLGKCIAAFQAEDRAEKLLRSFSLVRFTPGTIVEEMALHKELALVRARSYATDFEESTLGGCCLSAPIFGPDGLAIAAISISMPKMRFTNQERLIAAVKDAAAAISGELRGA
ncbi:MAG TPA: IclR family transcriptional regulator [Verrucomicrobiae bacterium]|nr:IclR family transcriptional regulator [Verrucomicrobiae bacterium]